MLDFLQSNLFAVLILFFLTLIAVLVSASKINMKKYGKSVTFGMILSSLIAGLLLMQESRLQGILIKVCIVSLMLLGWFVLFKYLKRKFSK